MFGFFRGSGNSNNSKRNSTPTKSTTQADYEPPVAASSSPSTLNQQHHHQQEDELFGGMTVHSNNYGNTSTHSTSSGSSSRLSTHREVTPTISTHDVGSSFSFINDDDTTPSASATTPQDEIENVQPVPGQIKINRSVGKGRRKNAKNSKVDEELKQLDQTSEELDRTYSMAQKTFSNIENNIKMNQTSRPSTTQIQSNINNNEEEEDDSTISSFLKNDEEEEPVQVTARPVTVEPRKSSSPSDEIDFASLQVKPRRLDKGNSSSEINSASTPVATTPVKVVEKPTVTTIKEEKPTRRESFKSETIEEEKETIDNDWINIKSSINSSLTKYSSRISKLLDEEQKKIDEKRENQFSLLQEKIQSLEQLLDEYTEQEEFEKADQIEQELTELRSKIEEIQVTEKNNDSYIPAISKTLTEMKKEINLVYSRVDFSFTTTKKDYDDFLKKNNPLKELRRERLESETNRIKRMGESIKLEENEFQKRKSRITAQIDSSTKDLRIQEDSLRDQNDEISREIAELERKLKEKKAEQKTVLSLLNDVTDKIKKYEEDFNEQLKLISYDEDQFQKRKQNYMDDVESFEKLSTTLNKDLNNIEAKETKKYDSMMDKRQYKDYLQTQQVRVSQTIDLVDRLDKLEESPASPNDSRPQIIKEVGALSQQLSTLKSHLSSVSMELDNSTQQLSRANDRLPKVQTDKLEYAKARKFKEAAQCKEESDKLTKLIQELESSIPSLKQEQTQLEEQKLRLNQELDAAHNRLEQVDKVDSKRFIRLCLKRIDFLEQNRAKLLEVETPEQLKLRFDVIDELLALFNYQVRQLKAIISLSDEELIEMKKSINTPAEVPKPKTPVIENVEKVEKVESPKPQVQVKEVKVVEENLSPKDKLVKLESNLEELKNTESKINDDINDALEKEQFDLCEVLDQQLEETKVKIAELKTKIEEVKSQIPPEETKEETPAEEEEPTANQVEEPTTEPQTVTVIEEAPQEEHVEEYQTFNDNEVAEEVSEEPSSFDFIASEEEPVEQVEETKEAETVAQETTEPSSFNFISEDSQNEEPKQEEASEESSFDFIASEETKEETAVEEPTTEQVPIVEANPESEPEEEKSSFGFIDSGNDEEKTENQEESSFGFLNE